MDRFFNMDNGFFRALTKGVDCVWLSLLFLVTSIPVFTIGASMTALYYAVQKSLKNDRGYVGGEYFHAFKTNFKQSTLVWLLVLVVGIILSVDVQFFRALDEVGQALGKAYLFFGALLVLLVVWVAYLFPYIARFENSTKAIMKNAAYMAILNLPRTLLLIVCMAVAALLVYIIPVTIFIVPALFTLVQNLIMEKIFRKYMSEEDRAAEDELNREFKN